MTEQTIEQIAAEAIHQRDVLMAAILKTAIDIKLVDPNAVITGPHLLMFCDDFTDYIKSLEQQLAEAKEQLAKLIPDSDTGD